MAHAPITTIANIYSEAARAKQWHDRFGNITDHHRYVDRITAANKLASTLPPEHSTTTTLTELKHAIEDGQFTTATALHNTLVN